MFHGINLKRLSLERRNNYLAVSIIVDNKIVVFCSVEGREYCVMDACSFGNSKDIIDYLKQTAYMGSKNVDFRFHVQVRVPL
jgi:hypothetical protein